MTKRILSVLLVLLTLALGMSSCSSNSRTSEISESAETTETPETTEPSDISETSDSSEISDTSEISEAEISSIDYSNSANWAYFGSEENKSVDVFFIAPTNVNGDTETKTNADVTDADDRSRMLSAIGMQTGIYQETGRFFAPYYSQMTLACYTLSEEEYAPYLQTAYSDVKAAFTYYMEHVNQGRPFIIAGFSQGADMGLRLLKEYGHTQSFEKQFVAAYLIGTAITEEDLQEASWLKMASGETDTGVIIAFECEAEEVTGTLIVPEGTRTYSINPLNWKTDATVATKEENLGYVYPNADGSVKVEIANLCGCWIDPERGTLKVTDITPEDYPARLSFLPSGSYHIYDYEFFYRNLQENVKIRTEAFLNPSAS